MSDLVPKVKNLFQVCVPDYIQIGPLSSSLFSFSLPFELNECQIGLFFPASFSLHKGLISQASPIFPTKNSTIIYLFNQNGFDFVNNIISKESCMFQSLTSVLGKISLKPGELVGYIIIQEV